MDDDDDDLRYSESTKLKHIVEQRNDKITTSLKNSPNIDTTFPKETHPLTSDRRRVRVKVAYSLDNDRLSPITQTTVIKSEPCFKVTATEDEVTKHFYRNKSQTISREQKITQFVRQKMPSDADSLDDEYSPEMIKERTTTSKIIQTTKHSVPDRTNSSSSIKPILKKPQKKQEEKLSIPKTDRSLTHRSLSPSASLNKKQTSSTRHDFNEVQDLAKNTAEQNPSLSSIYPRSLFSQTMSIFDPDNSYQIPSKSLRPSRLQYYIKPYRGEAYVPTNLNKQRSRSLPQHRFTQLSSSKPRWDTFPNQYARQSNRKQHVSWSPVREYIPQGRDNKIITPTKRKDILSDRTNSSLLSTIPSLGNSSSIIPIPIHFRKSQSSQFPSPSPSTDSYYTPSIVDRPLILLKPALRNSYSHEETESMFRSSLPDMVHQHKKEHNQTMQQYDRLLEKMRTTDKELEFLSQSWMNNTTRQRTPVSNNYSLNQQGRVRREPNLLLNKTTNNSQFCSPMILQMCFIILVIFNLLIVYFFNEINLWWNEHVAPALIGEQHDQENFNV